MKLEGSLSLLKNLGLYPECELSWVYHFSSCKVHYTHADRYQWLQFYWCWDMCLNMSTEGWDRGNFIHAIYEIKITVMYVDTWLL